MATPSNLSASDLPSVPHIQPIAQACAITFQGNASNGRQQDAVYLSNSIRS